MELPAGIVGELVGDIIMPGYKVSSSTTSPNLKYASVFKIGRTTEEQKTNVILLAPINKSETTDFTGISGRLYILRGNKIAAVRTLVFDVTCVYAYNSISKIISIDARVGLCSYQGTTYIAVQIPQGNSSDVFLSGFYSNIVPNIVLDSEVTWE